MYTIYYGDRGHGAGSDGHGYPGCPEITRIYCARHSIRHRQIKPESQPLIDQVAQAMKAEPEMKVSIEGHTDNTGDPAANKKLSERRAKAVQESLVAKGIAAARLSSRGWGQEKPVADNRSEEGKAKNRRVEIIKK
ncbi:MAG: hypothetical protein C4336_00170 [Armatimonadota bacterium]